MKILFVASNNRGAPAPFVTEQADSLRGRGHEVTVFGVEGHGAAGYLHNVSKLRSVLCSVRPDIVHAHYGLCGLLACIACVGLRVPVVVTYHGSDINDPSVLRFSRIAMRLASRNVFISLKTMEVALSDASSKLRRSSRLVPCGINLEDYPFVEKGEARARLGLREDGTYILFAGAFDNAVKNASLARAAAALIPEAELLELKGYDREGVCNVMSACDALLMTSHSEGSPQVVKEALATGLPVVSVDVGDVAQRLEGLPHCRICPRSAGALSEALREVAAITTPREEMRRMGRERLIGSGLTNDNVVEQLLGIYKSVTKPHNDGGRQGIETAAVRVRPVSAGEDSAVWRELSQGNPTASWFQTPEALDFFGSLSFLEPFAFGVFESGVLKGVMAGFIQKEGGPLKRFLSRRAIVNGGPLLSKDISPVALEVLLKGAAKGLKHKAIYLETRNYHDYSDCKDAFLSAGWDYEPHYNFHIDTSCLEIAEANLGKSRRRDVRTSLRDGAEVVADPTESEVREFHSLLRNLYASKVRTPLFPEEFFLSISRRDDARFILVRFRGVVVGGTLCVGTPGGTLYEWFACGDESLSRVSLAEGETPAVYPSTLATWAGISYAAGHGHPLFDMMGAGAPGDGGYGVRDFKAKFGGTLVEHGRFRHVNSRLLFATGTLGVRVLKGELFKKKKI